MSLFPVSFFRGKVPLGLQSCLVLTARFHTNKSEGVGNMDRPILVHEGLRTFQTFEATIEIIVFRQTKFGLYEVLARDQNSHFELRPIYLRACVVDQRIVAVDTDQLLNSFRMKFDPERYLNDKELFDLVVRVSVFDYIADRLSLKKKTTGCANFYELEYVPAALDPEFGPDKTRLFQLICKDPYRHGAPAPYMETLKAKDELSKQPKTIVVSKRRLSGLIGGLSFLISSSMSTKSDSSRRTATVPSTACTSRASVEFTESMKVAVQRSMNGNEDSHSAQDVQNFARQVFHQLSKIPDICEEPLPDGRLFPVSNENPVPSPDQTQAEPHQRAVTTEQLRAYFAGSCLHLGESQNDIDVRARIPYRQHPSLTPPKCVAHLAVKATRSTSSSINLDLSEKVASPLVVQQVKPTIKAAAPIPSFTKATSTASVAPVRLFSLLGMLFVGSSRVGVAPA